MLELGQISSEKSSRSQHDDPEYGITVTKARFLLSPLIKQWESMYRIGRGDYSGSSAKGYCSLGRNDWTLEGFCFVF
jgi:hypothetical protein